METFYENLQLLLKSQYLHLEEYVNSQTQLRNILVQQAPPCESLLLLSYYDEQQRQAAVQGVYESTERVREDLENLKILINTIATSGSNDRHRLVLEEHLRCSERVVTTCFKCGNLWHELGIPVAYNQTQASEIQLVALATLKASITQLRESLD